MLTKDPPSIFPLHLAPIDRLFLQEDNDRHPMTSVIQLDFRGVLRPREFDDAVAEAQKRHPLLRALVQSAKGGKPCWVAATNSTVPVEVGGMNNALVLTDGESIDLTKEIGLRLWVQTTDTHSRVSVQVHHACTDGTGIYRFLGDVLAIYASSTDPNLIPMPLADLDPKLLRRRRSKMADRAIHGTAWEFIRNGMTYASRLLATPINGLHAPVGGMLPSPTPFPGICTFVFDQDEQQRLRQAASNHGALLNDLLLAELLRAVDQWNSQHGDHSGRKRIRLLMPSDLRDENDFEMPAANMTAYTFVTRRRQECRDFGQLMSSIRDETARIKFGRTGKSFVDALMLLDYFPKAWSLFRGISSCMATATLSNTGDPTKRFLSKLPRQDGQLVCGNLTLEEITGVPPIRDGNNVTIAVFTYRRRCTVCLRCNPYLFSREDSHQFLEKYIASLRRHL